MEQLQIQTSLVKRLTANLVKKIIQWKNALFGELIRIKTFFFFFTQRFISKAVKLINLFHFHYFRFVYLQLSIPLIKSILNSVTTQTQWLEIEKFYWPSYFLEIINFYIGFNLYFERNLCKIAKHYWIPETHLACWHIVYI